MVVKGRPPILRVSQSVCWADVTLASFWGSVTHTKKKRMKKSLSDHVNTSSDSGWDSCSRLDMQHSPMNGSPSDTYSTSSSLLGTQVTKWVWHAHNAPRITLIVITAGAHLIRAMSSMRPPFPLYRQEALIPNLLLATDSKSDKVPYTATTWKENNENQWVVRDSLEVWNKMGHSSCLIQD